MKVVRCFTWALLAIGAIGFAGAQDAAGVYKANCAMCHGAAGDGNTPAGKKFNVPSFSTPTAIGEPDATLLSVVKDGKGKMPAWKSKLNEDQVKDVVAYIRTLQKKS